jgi:SAM-dependent methyltransferase
MTHSLVPHDFETVFPAMTDYLRHRISGYGFVHEDLTAAEREAVLLKCVKALQEPLKIAGEHRKPDWEEGWAQNELMFNPAKAGRELAKPRYHGKYPYVRWKGDFYRAMSEDYEHNMLAVIEDYVFDKYFREMLAVYEFGCGTGHNLFRVRDVNPRAELVGLDWAASACRFINLQAVAGAYGFSPIEPTYPLAHGVEWDFFHPNWEFNFLTPRAGVYTVAALEQTGHRFHAWLDYILRQKPEIVAHIEPIGEVLDPSVLNDYLALEYFKKRGYLEGYLDFLRLLEHAGKLRIHEVTRTTIGSLFIEGYSIIVWSPL